MWLCLAFWGRGVIINLIVKLKFCLVSKKEMGEGIALQYTSLGFTNGTCIYLKHSLHLFSLPSQIISIIYNSQQ